VEKYGEAMAQIGVSQDGFSQQYGVPLRIAIRRVRGF
jgi:hypothetical protein